MHIPASTKCARYRARNALSLLRIGIIEDLKTPLLPCEARQPLHGPEHEEVGWSAPQIDIREGESPYISYKSVSIFKAHVTQ